MTKAEQQFEEALPQANQGSSPGRWTGSTWIGTWGSYLGRWTESRSSIVGELDGEYLERYLE